MLPLSYRLSRRVEISCGGKAWPILFTHEVLLSILELTGLDAFAGQVSMAAPSGKLLRAALYAVLRASGADLSIEEAGKLLRLGNMPKIRTALIDAWDASMADPEPRKQDGPARKALSRMDAWAIAGEIDIPEEEWMRMTPRMLHARSQQRLETMRWHELLIGRLIAETVNHSFCAPKEPRKAKDFMLHPWVEEEDVESVPGGAESMCAAYGIPLKALTSDTPVEGVIRPTVPPGK